DDRIVAVGHPLLERDDPVVGDVDVLGAHLGAALRDVAEAHAGLLPHELRPIAGVERVHVEAGQLDEEARPREILLLLLVVADDVADVLAQEALDALVELLDAIDVLLHHPIGAVGLRRLQAERRDLLGLLVVVRHVGDEIADQREGPDRRDADGLAGREGVHPGHAHEPGLAVDLRAARAALAGLAVPPAGQVARLGGLQAMDHVEDDHALVEVDVVGLEFAAACLRSSSFFRASFSTLSVRMMPTRFCMVSCRSAWIAYGFSPPLRENGSSMSRAIDSTWPESTVSCPPKSFA